MKFSHTQKQLILEAIRQRGIRRDGAEAGGVTVAELNLELKRSKIFRQLVNEATKEGNINLSDKGKLLLANYIEGLVDRTDRNALTAAIASLNAYEPGFKGVSTVQGRIEHDVRVITAVPRPKYTEIEAPKVTVIETPKPKKLLKNAFHRTEAEQREYDRVEQSKASAVMNGEPITKVGTIEQVIEGEVLNES